MQPGQMYKRKGLAGFSCNLSRWRPAWRSVGFRKSPWPLSKGAFPITSTIRGIPGLVSLSCNGIRWLRRSLSQEAKERVAYSSFLRCKQLRIKCGLPWHRINADTTPPGTRHRVSLVLQQTDIGLSNNLLGLQSKNAAPQNNL